ncbi:MAG: DUF1631 family protein [Thermomonas sp.]|nr:DUF1631 family protein [Thermomonas sp.]
MEAAELDPCVRIVVFKFFERELATTPGHAYERSNALLLVAAGILPQLRATSRKPGAKRGPSMAAPRRSGRRFRQARPPQPGGDARATPQSAHGRRRRCSPTCWGCCRAGARRWDTMAGKAAPARRSPWVRMNW